MAKKEFTVKFHKDVNEAWSGSAYFVNDILGRKYIVSAAAAPRDKKTTSVSVIKEYLDGYENEMRDRHYGWCRVTEEEYNKFLAK